MLRYIAPCKHKVYDDKRLSFCNTGYYFADKVYIISYNLQTSVDQLPQLNKPRQESNLLMTSYKISENYLFLSSVGDNFEITKWFLRDFIPWYHNMKSF